jgi:hypothetical protein
LPYVVTLLPGLRRGAVHVFDRDSPHAHTNKK